MRWANLLPRLAFAPVTEMTEGFIKNSVREMERERELRRAQVPANADDDSDE